MSVVLCLLLFFQLVRIVVKSSSTDREIRAMQSAHTQLVQEYNQLERMRSYLDSDFFAEREARVHLGYKKEGEKVVIIQSPKQTEAHGINSSDTNRSQGRAVGAVSTPDRNPERWRQYFFGHHD